MTCDSRKREGRTIWKHIFKSVQKVVLVIIGLKNYLIARYKKIARVVEMYKPHTKPQYRPNRYVIPSPSHSQAWGGVENYRICKLISSGYISVDDQ